MSLFARWCRFNLVGAMGMLVQLGVLAVLNRCLRGHYLLATAVAIELTLLHNFFWHQRYTWHERTDGTRWGQRMVRFQMSNGLVSLLGNLVLMRLLVQRAHLPVLPANALAIVCCSLANFALGEAWAFARREVASERKFSPIRITVLTFTVYVATLSAGAQSSPRTDLPDAPGVLPRQSGIVPTAAAARFHLKPSASYLSRAGLICGVGASTSPVATKPAGGCGAGFMFLPLPIFVEVGLMGPQANRSPISGYVSVDADIPLAKPTVVYLPIAMAGYTRLFETGHALDYGLALAMPRFGHAKDTTDSMRIELRDYWTFANPAQHNVMLRLGWMSLLRD